MTQEEFEWDYLNEMLRQIGIFIDNQRELTGKMMMDRHRILGIMELMKNRQEEAKKVTFKWKA